MVSEDWDSSLNSIIYDKDGYDFEKDKLTFKPTDDDIYKNFVDRFFMVVDRETQFITIEFDHFSPYFAQEALFKLINEVNSEVRRREVDRTKKSIEYLNNQVEKTSSVDLKFLFIVLLTCKNKEEILFLRKFNKINFNIKKFIISLIFYRDNCSNKKMSRINPP